MYACMYAYAHVVANHARVYTGVFEVPPATKPDSPNCIATPKPPSLTGAEFSFEANSTQ